MMQERITVPEADERLLRQVRLLPAIRCPLAKAAGRVLREPLVADRDLPPFDRVMMDGYAARMDGISDQPLRVTGEAPAGARQLKLPEGEGVAVEVMTGARLPEGADVVIPYEWTDRDGDTFRLKSDAGPEPGRFIHRRASDYRAGATLVPQGRVLGAVEAGIAASCGYAEVLVSQKPRVALFGTGDELVPVEATPNAHQIRRSNIHAVQNALSGSGYGAGTTGHLSDDAAAQQSVIEEAAADADVVIISGAVSRGRRDWVPGALDAIGACVFHGVAQKPGGPMGFWVTGGGCCIFALPGNPVSTLVAVHRYVIPFMRAMQGLPPVPARKLGLNAEFSFEAPITCFLPVRRVDGGQASPAPVNNSGDYARLAETDGFLELPGHENYWLGGTSLPYYPWIR